MINKIVFSLIFNLLGLIAWCQLPELSDQKKQLKSEIKAILYSESQGINQVYSTLSLARSYYKLDKYQAAEKEYLKVIGDPVCTILDFKALATCLKFSGKMSLANEFYQAYASESPTTTFNKLWPVNTEMQQGVAKATVTKLTNFNFIYGNVNPDGSTNLNIDNGTVTANVSCESFINLEAVQFPVESFNKLGSFTKGGKKSSYYYSYKKLDNRFAIYFVENKKGKWTKPKEMVLGEASADYCFPFFINSTLYYSSNKGGGFGDYDLYKASVNGEKAIEIENLGPNINTDKNEVLASAHNGHFSFSSNGFPGQGGYDIFSSDWSFNRVTALQFPFNSRANEFILIHKDAEKVSLIRSNTDKINVVRVQYYVDYQRTLQGQVVDEQSNTVDNARVLFTKSYVDQGIFQTSQNDGSFSVIIPGTIDTWMIECHKPGFIKNSFEVDLSTLGDNPLIIVLEPIPTVKPEPAFIVSSKSRNIILSEPEIQDSSNVQSTANTHTEVNNGGRYYVVFASSKSYTSAYKTWNKLKIQYPSVEILKNEEMNVYRVGIFAGTSQTETMKTYLEVRKSAPDVWILRPDML
ncbi:MAG: hypothetical protein ACI8SE_001548 [Bacteroidia bacterium]|jgi:hypothetical protein